MRCGGIKSIKYKFPLLRFVVKAHRAFLSFQKLKIPISQKKKIDILIDTVKMRGNHENRSFKLKQEIFFERLHFLPWTVQLH